MREILSRILDRVGERTERRKKELPFEVLQSKITTFPPPRDFAESLKGKTGINIIAEVKKASPSKGLILKDYEPVKIAKIYEKTGAKAISVLTEEDFFLGNLNDLRSVKNATRIPVLRKDFIADTYQIYESRYFGADAILLIARILKREVLEEFIAISKNLGLASLVEIHDEEDFSKALGCGAEIMGINNRDIDTLKVDINVSLRLAPLIPSDRIIVSESGIRGKEEILLLKNRGINSFLIGESLLTTENIEKKMEEMLH
ncbi:MAG TPA: indole-3-glycerol phosphate synthase TrpC [Candidatus Omnitrophica bacterium]|nr:indole-3-glycerol phosphate synthase TrpC [Candidatus Omnitrophota bacterium]